MVSSAKSEFASVQSTISEISDEWLCWGDYGIEIEPGKGGITFPGIDHMWDGFKTKDKDGNDSSSSKSKSKSESKAQNTATNTASTNTPINITNTNTAQGGQGGNAQIGDINVNAPAGVTPTSPSGDEPGIGGRAEDPYDPGGLRPPDDGGWNGPDDGDFHPVDPPKPVDPPSVDPIDPVEPARTEPPGGSINPAGDVPDTDVQSHWVDTPTIRPSGDDDRTVEGFSDGGLGAGIQSIGHALGTGDDDAGAGLAGADGVDGTEGDDGSGETSASGVGADGLDGGAGQGGAGGGSGTGTGTGATSGTAPVGSSTGGSGIGTPGVRMAGGAGMMPMGGAGGGRSKDKDHERRYKQYGSITGDEDEVDPETGMTVMDGVIGDDPV